MIKKAYLIALALAFCIALISFSTALAGDEESQSGLVVPTLAKESIKLDKKIEAGIDHLYKMLGDKSVAFDPSKVESMLDLVANSNEDPKDIEPAKRFNGRGVCLRQSINSDLDNLLRYFYNKDIPSFLLSPAMLRFSNWYPDSEFMQRQTPIWEELENLDSPVFVRGREFESCTPDSFGEAYFSYDLDRLLILTKYQGKRTLISISLQDGESDVGRKGAIINDKEWDYFYSGIEGLNRGLIGWMDTYMYNSASVVVFMEQDQAAKQSSLFIFKWLKAGWSGMNVVKRKHIYEGLMRYARSMETVVASSAMTPEELALSMAEVKTMPKSQVNAIIEKYAANFEKKFKDDSKLKSRSYAKIIADGGYSEVLDDRARLYVVYLEKLKGMLGMDTLVEVGSATAAN